MLEEKEEWICPFNQSIWPPSSHKSFFMVVVHNCLFYFDQFEAIFLFEMGTSRPANTAFNRGQQRTNQDRQSHRDCACHRRHLKEQRHQRKQPSGCSWCHGEHPVVVAGKVRTYWHILSFKLVRTNLEGQAGFTTYINIWHSVQFHRYSYAFLSFICLRWGPSPRSNGQRHFVPFFWI